MAAVAVIKQYIGNNHEAMCSLGCVVNRFVLYYANVKKRISGKWANAYERHDISDESWAKIEFLLPGRKGTWGGQRSRQPAIYQCGILDFTNGGTLA